MRSSDMMRVQSLGTTLPEDEPRGKELKGQMGRFDVTIHQFLRLSIRATD